MTTYKFIKTKKTTMVTTTLLVSRGLVTKLMNSLKRIIFNNLPFDDSDYHLRKFFDKVTLKNFHVN